MSRNFTITAAFTDDDPYRQFAELVARGVERSYAAWRIAIRHNLTTAQEQALVGRAGS